MNAPPASPTPTGGPTMTLAEHLEELRGCLIRSLVGLALAAGVCLAFGNRIFAFLAQPLLLALRITGHDPALYVASLPEAFVTYVNVGIYAGVFLASPWIFYQLWGFVAAGLYPHERRYVRLVAPFSFLLFILGGLFFLWIVAPLSCLFFIRFAGGIETPQLQDNFFTRAVARSVLGHDDLEHLPPPPATDVVEPAAAEAEPPLVRPLFTLQNYVSLILVMALAFSLAFQTPLLVFLLGRLGILEMSHFRAGRKYVFCGLFIVAAVATPPDVISQVALALPMYALYELGGLLLRLWPGPSRL